MLCRMFTVTGIFDVSDVETSGSPSEADRDAVLSFDLELNFGAVMLSREMLEETLGNPVAELQLDEED